MHSLNDRLHNGALIIVRKGPWCTRDSNLHSHVIETITTLGSNISLPFKATKAFKGVILFITVLMETASNAWQVGPLMTSRTLITHLPVCFRKSSGSP